MCSVCVLCKYDNRANFHCEVQLLFLWTLLQIRIWPKWILLKLHSHYSYVLVGEGGWICLTRVHFECSCRSFFNFFFFFNRSIVLLDVNVSCFFLPICPNTREITFPLSELESLVELTALASVCNNHSNVNIAGFVFWFLHNKNVF